MTWSIVARDGQGRFGVAIASRFLAVGALCVHTRRDVGALSTQALMNPLYGAAGLALLADGEPAVQALQRLLAGDEGRAHRQVHLLPAVGAPVAHTGSQCIDWCGHQLFDDFSVAGNMLAGPQVIEATAQAYRDAHRLPFAERLLVAMQAGEAAGGDKRGKQSAALLIHGTEEWPLLDLRVDDHTDPLRELQRLEAVSREHWVPFRTFMPTRGNPSGTSDRAAINAAIAAASASRE